MHCMMMAKPCWRPHEDKVATPSTNMQSCLCHVLALTTCTCMCTHARSMQGRIEFCKLAIIAKLKFWMLS